MDIAELQQKIEHFNGREDNIRARLEAATSDTERFRLERDLRILQNYQWALLGSIERQLDRDTARGTTDSPLDHQATA
jgi:hypothetical protein